MNTILEIIHNEHQLAKAFNTTYGLPMTVLYCITCAGHFHGCYCDKVEECENCETLKEVEVF